MNALYDTMCKAHTYTKRIQIVQKKFVTDRQY